MATFDKYTKALVAVMALFFISSVSSQTCGPSTCPAGPVVVQFENSDCTGTHVYSPLNREAQCSSGSFATISDQEVTLYTVNNPQCDITLANSSYIAVGFRFGVCGPAPTTKRDARDEETNLSNPVDVLAHLFNMASITSSQLTRGDMAGHSASAFLSMIILKNVNTSWTYPQSPFQYNPAIASLPTSLEPCDAIDNCTAPTGSSFDFYTTEYGEPDCTGSFPISQMHLNQTFDESTCYRQNETYVTLHCVDEHAFQATYHYGDSCDNPAYSFVISRYVCSSNRDSTYHCLAPPPVSPVPASCPPNPGSGFICINGIWKSSGSISIPTITVPSIGSGQGSVSIVIEGNLTITESITFSGLSSQIFVNGCIFLGDSLVTIELTKEDIEQLEKEKSPLSKTLLSVNGTCGGSSDLSGVVVSATSNSGLKKCQKLKAKNSGSSPTSLVVAFSIDSGSCNTKWIILGSVLGGVIVLSAIVMALLVTFNSTVRTKILPFSKPK